MDSQTKGKLGEKLAIRYLEQHGLCILQTNYHSRWGEIDIIAQDNTFILFIEVKLRKQNSLVTPGESVINSKQQKIFKTAYQYLNANNFKLQPRFDVIEVTILKDKKFSINHIKNAFWQNKEYSVF